MERVARRDWEHDITLFSRDSGLLVLAQPRDDALASFIHTNRQTHTRAGRVGQGSFTCGTQLESAASSARRAGRGAEAVAAGRQVWLNEIKRKFRAATAGFEDERRGWNLLFSKYDADGSGELDQPEFNVAVRTF